MLPIQHDPVCDGAALHVLPESRKGNYINAFSPMVHTRRTNQVKAGDGAALQVLPGGQNWYTSQSPAVQQAACE